MFKMYLFMYSAHLEWHHDQLTILHIWVFIFNLVEFNLIGPGGD